MSQREVITVVSPLPNTNCHCQDHLAQGNKKELMIVVVAAIPNIHAIHHIGNQHYRDHLAQVIANEKILDVNLVLRIVL